MFLLFRERSAWVDLKQYANVTEQRSAVVPAFYPGQRTVTKKLAARETPRSSGQTPQKTALWLRDVGRPVSGPILRQYSSLPCWAPRLGNGSSDMMDRLTLLHKEAKRSCDRRWQT